MARSGSATLWPILQCMGGMLFLFLCGTVNIMMCVSCYHYRYNIGISLIPVLELPSMQTFYSHSTKSTDMWRLYMKFRTMRRLFLGFMKVHHHCESHKYFNENLKFMTDFHTEQCALEKYNL